MFGVTSKYFLNPLNLGFLRCTLGTRESYFSERVRFVCDGACAVPGLRKCSAATATPALLRAPLDWCLCLAWDCLLSPQPRAGPLATPGGLSSPWLLWPCLTTPAPEPFTALTPTTSFSAQSTFLPPISWTQHCSGREASPWLPLPLFPCIADSRGSERLQAVCSASVDV